MRLSIFDIYKIGVGPSSSHTLGPWRAALDFREMIAGSQVQSLSVQLFGSLSKTGIGHGTDVAVMLGLQGFDPVTMPTRDIPSIIEGVKLERTLLINDHRVPFDYTQDLIFQTTTHPGHPNTLTFTALLADGRLERQTYFSLGGGFIEREGEESTEAEEHPFIHDVSSGRKMIELSKSTKKTISRLLYENERCIYTSDQIHDKIERIFQVMLDCVYRGCHTEGILPGGLNVKRRAASLNKKLLAGKIYPDRKSWLAAVRRSPREFATVNQWISCFALAVNEENAALGRVVTSPTNGASGVIPAVLLYHYLFGNFGDNDLMRFFMSSGQVGALFKQGSYDLGRRRRLSGGGRGELGHGCRRAYGGDGGQYPSGTYGRRDRHGAPPGAHLRPHRRARTNTLHRTQRYGSHEGDHRRQPRDGRYGHYSHSTLRRGGSYHVGDRPVYAQPV